MVITDNGIGLIVIKIWKELAWKYEKEDRNVFYKFRNSFITRQWVCTKNRIPYLGAVKPGHWQPPVVQVD